MNKNVDLGLAVIEAVAKKIGLTAVELDSKDIAEICGVHRNLIDNISATAKKKLKQLNIKEWLNEDHKA